MTEKIKYSTTFVGIKTHCYAIVDDVVVCDITVRSDDHKVTAKLLKKMAEAYAKSATEEHVV